MKNLSDAITFFNKIEPVLPLVVTFLHEISDNFVLPVVTFALISPSHFTEDAFMLPVDTERSSFSADMFSARMLPVLVFILISSEAEA